MSARRVAVAFLVEVDEGRDIDPGALELVDTSGREPAPVAAVLVVVHPDPAAVFSDVELEGAACECCGLERSACECLGPRS